MTELALIAVISGLGLVYAVVTARGLLQRSAGDAPVQRVSQIVGGGIQSYLRRHDIVVVAAAGVLGASVFLAYGAAYQAEVVSAVAPREFGVWLAGSYSLGVALAIGAGRAAAWVNRMASGRVASGARHSLDQTLQISIRAAGASGIGAMALALLTLAGLFAAALSIGGEGSDAALTAAGIENVPIRLAGFVLGAAFVALLAQLGGGIFGKVADMGADIGGKLDASLPEDSPDNPATVADLVGDVVGDHVGRTAGAMATSLTVAFGAMLVARILLLENPELPGATALVLFPLVTQSFGLLASCFGTTVVRTDDREVPMNALVRGLLVTTLLYAVAAVGAARWLLDSHWVAYSGCAVAGCVGSLACVYAIQYYTDSKYRPVRSLAEAARSGPTLALLRGILAAVEGTAVILVAVLALALGCYELGNGTGLSSGGLFGLAVGGLGLLGSLPFVLAMDGLGSIVDCAGGIVALTVGAERPDVRARARLLDAMGNTAKGLSGVLATVASALGCFLVLSAILAEAWRAHSEPANDRHLDVDNALLYAGAALGVVVILAFIGAALGRVAQAVRDFLFELRGRLESVSPDGSSGGSEGEVEAARRRLGAGASAAAGEPPLSADGPEDADAAHAGAQLACVEVASRLALRGMLPPVLVGVGLPLLLGAALRITATGDTVVQSAEALVALLVVATIAGALSSLLFSNAGSAWDNAKKYIETGAHGGRYVQDARRHTLRGSSTRATSSRSVGQDDDGWEDNPTYVAAVIGDTLGDPLKGVVGPATQALVQTLSMLALAFLPFFL